MIIQSFAQRRALNRARLCTVSVLAAGVAIFIPRGPSEPRAADTMPVQAVRDDTAQCRLDACSVRRRVGFIVVTGVVRNVSSRLCRTVEVVSDAHGQYDVVLDQASALVETKDLLPGQTSAFTVVMDDNPRIVSVSLRLRPLQMSPLTPPIAVAGVSPAGTDAGDDP